MTTATNCQRSIQLKQFVTRNHLFSYFVLFLYCYFVVIVFVVGNIDQSVNSVLMNALLRFIYVYL